MWTGTAAIPVDFEFACLGPADPDLEKVLRSLVEYPDAAATDHLLRLAEPLLARPGAHDRLLGYAVLRDLWALDLWLRASDTPGVVESWGVDPDNVPAWRPSTYLRHHATGDSWAAAL